MGGYFSNETTPDLGVLFIDLLREDVSVETMQMFIEEYGYENIKIKYFDKLATPLHITLHGYYAGNDFVINTTHKANFEAWCLMLFDYEYKTYGSLDTVFRFDGETEHTALTLAIRTKSKVLVEKALSLNASKAITLYDQEEDLDLTPLDIASIYGTLDIVQLIN